MVMDKMLIRCLADMKLQLDLISCVYLVSEKQVDLFRSGPVGRLEIQNSEKMALCEGVNIPEEILVGLFSLDDDDICSRGDHCSIIDFPFSTFQ